MTEALQTRPRSGARKFIVAILCALVLPCLLLVLGVLHSTRLRDGVVVLTGTACQVLAYHGARLDRLEGGTLCAIRAPSRFGDNATTGRIVIPTDDGELEVQLLRSEVVSTTY